MNHTDIGEERYFEGNQVEPGKGPDYFEKANREIFSTNGE